MKINLTIVEVFESSSFKTEDGKEVILYPFEVKEIKALKGHHGYEFNSLKPIPQGCKRCSAELIPSGNNEFKLGKWEFL